MWRQGADWMPTLLGRRCLASYASELKAIQWPALKQEMTDFFNRIRPTGSDSTVLQPVKLQALPWPRFVNQEALRYDGLLPAAVWKYGSFQRLCFKMDDVWPLAFEEEFGHVSLRFTARPIEILFGDIKQICVVSHLQVDPVEKYIYFMKMARHIPGQITELEIPCSLQGLLACPAYLKGHQVELATPTIKCQIAGEAFPQPFQIDVSKFEHKSPYTCILLKSIEHLLPNDGSVRFHPKYDLEKQEIVWSYEAGTLQEEKLPPTWVDPNFVNKHGRRIHLTFKGYWPKQ